MSLSRVALAPVLAVSCLTSMVEVVDAALDLLRVCTPLSSDAFLEALLTGGFFVGLVVSPTPFGSSGTLVDAGSSFLGLGMPNGLATALPFAPFVPLGGMFAKLLVLWCACLRSWMNSVRRVSTESFDTQKSVRDR